MLYQKIKQDSLQARKSGNKLVAQALVTLASEIQAQGKTEQERSAPSDEVSISVIKKFIKNLDETIRVSGPGLMSKNVLERDILATYLPAQLTEDEIKTIIAGLKGNPGEDLIMEPTMGNIMSYFKNMYPGRYDGALVSKLAR